VQCITQHEFLTANLGPKYVECVKVKLSLCFN